MNKASRKPRLYTVLSAVLEDEVVLSTGVKKKDVVVVEIKGIDNETQTIFVYPKHELLRKKNPSKVPDYIGNVGSVVSLATEMQIKDVTGYMSKDKDGKEIEVLHEEDRAQPTPFGRVASDTEIQEFMDDLQAEKADNRRLKNIKTETHARDEALQTLPATSLAFYRENPMFASAVIGR